MLFNQMRDKILSVKDPSCGWKYGNWNRLFYDEHANMCYMGWAKYEWNGRSREFIGYTKLSEAHIVFRPDNIALLNSDKQTADYFVLRSLTLNGKINRGKDFRSRYIYTHDLQNVYETIPFMEISMKTSKPIKARLLNKIPVDKNRLIVVRDAIKDLRASIKLILRVNDTKLKQAELKERFDILANHDNNAKRIAMIIEAYIKDRSMKKDWAKSIFRLMSAHYTINPINAINQFDSMIRFHDAALFRNLGVTR